MHGRVYHKVGTLYPQSEYQPKYSQLYIYDPAEATSHRTACFPDLNSEVLKELHDMLVEDLPDVDMWTGAGAVPAQLVQRNPYPSHFFDMNTKMVEAQAVFQKEQPSDSSRHSRTVPNWSGTLLFYLSAFC